MTLRSRSPRPGFTFIDLLVVIAIIAILAAILFPVFAKAREKARQASCQSNNKQIGLAFAQYTQDYDERYSFREMGGPTPASYRVVMDPYIKNQQIWKCPSNPSLTTDWTNNQYSANYTLNDANAQFNGQAPSLASIASPANKFLQVELRNQPWTDYASSWWCSGNNPNNAASCCYDQGYAGHTRTVTYLFGDYHVKSLRPTQTTNGPVSMWDFNNDNPQQCYITGAQILEGQIP